MSQDSVPALRPARVCGAGHNVGLDSVRPRVPSVAIPLQLKRPATPRVLPVSIPAPAVVLPDRTQGWDTFKVLLLVLNVIEALVLAMILARS